MSKKSKTVEDAIKNLNISAAMGGESTRQSVKGKTVSLNLKAETFFGVGGVWLSPKNYSCTIPSTISSNEEDIIIKALQAGILVEGNVYISPIDRDPEVLEEYWQLIKAFGLDPSDKKSKSVTKFQKLMRNPTDRNWTAKEIAKYCIEQEQKNKHRDKVIKLLTDLHRTALCPDTLLETR